MKPTYETYRMAVEEALRAYAPGNGASSENRCLPSLPIGANDVPQPLGNAMAYSLLLPGKRLRPVLLLAAYHLLREDWRDALPFACALEMIHAYSLIHDDLPAMDNDDLRRGQPTNHRVFGEDMAILAGDALLNHAFTTMLGAAVSRERPQPALAAAHAIAVRAGAGGMVGGQSLDVKLEGAAVTVDNVRYIHLHKTADLFIAAMEAGLTLAGANEAQLKAGRTYGQCLGVAFQITDDLLDIGGDAALLGKQVGKDAQHGKQTWPAAVGVERARKDAEAYLAQATDSIRFFGDASEFFTNLSQKLLVRKQ